MPQQFEEHSSVESSVTNQQAQSTEQYLGGFSVASSISPWVRQTLPTDSSFVTNSDFE